MNDDQHLVIGFLLIVALLAAAFICELQDAHKTHTLDSTIITKLK
jgi:hypothetical protein